jgi:hypothetical protein
MRKLDNLAGETASQELRNKLLLQSTSGILTHLRETPIFTQPLRAWVCRLGKQ